MTTIDQKRMLKLAGLLKEGVEEWIDEEEEFERMPKQMGMGRGAGLEETYIDNMKEAIRAIVREVLLEKAKTKRK